MSTSNRREQGGGFLTLKEVIEMQTTSDKIFPTVGSLEENDIMNHLQRQLKGNPVAVDLRLGSEVFVSDTGEIRTLTENGTDSIIKIEPGSFAQLLIHEKLKIPLNILAFISMKFSYKVKGLINVSGFHVDPGYEGRIVFSVYNAGPNTIPLKRGDPVFMIIFARIGQKVEQRVQSKFQDTYHINTVHIEGLLGESISPRNLDARIKELEKMQETITDLQKGRDDYKLFKKLVIIVGSVSGIVITAILEAIFSGSFGSLHGGHG